MFSHQYEKKDIYLKAEPGVPYEVVRAPSYKYSDDAKDKFFQQPELAFLFVFFATDERARSLSVSKFKQDNKKDEPIIF